MRSGASGGTAFGPLIAAMFIAVSNLFSATRANG
jgi:hypothetical protein